MNALKPVLSWGNEPTRMRMKLSLECIKGGAEYENPSIEKHARDLNFAYNKVL
jgi:hypothetical protein